MKTMKLSKKLTLTKETVSNLNNPEMINIQGGTFRTRYSICPTCDVSDCYQRTVCIVCGKEY